LPETSPLGLYSDRTALKRHTDPALPFRSRAVVDHCSGRHFACRAVDRFLVFIAVGARRIRGRRQVDQPSVRLDLSAGQRPTVHLVPRSVQADVDAADERFLSECMVAKIGDEQQRIDWASLYARRFQFVDKPTPQHARKRSSACLLALSLQPFSLKADSDASLRKLRWQGNTY
jgi:hypothetical protein